MLEYDIKAGPRGDQTKEVKRITITAKSKEEYELLASFAEQLRLGNFRFWVSEMKKKMAITRFVEGFGSPPTKGGA